MKLRKQIEKLEKQLEKTQADIEYIEGFDLLTQEQGEHVNRLYDFEMRIEKQLNLLRRQEYNSRKCNHVNKNTQRLIDNNII